MTIYFSASKLAFYNDELKAAYAAAGSWPSDAVAVTTADQATYTTTPPSGKMLGATSAGQPTWVAAPVVTPTLAAQAQALLSAGITVTSTATPALNGTYRVASGIPYGREDIGSEAQFVSTFSEFTNGKTTLDWPLADGKTMVTFPTTADFLNFAKAAAQFYSSVIAAVQSNGTLPSPDVTIP